MSQRPWSQREYRIIDELMAKSICKIIIEKESATGFFLKINLDNGHILALVTNEHVLDEKFFKDNKKISFLLNNGEHKIELNLDPYEGRYHLIEKIYDTTFVEIKEDELDENIIKFLEVDERLSIQTESLINEEIYILNYPEDNESKNSPGKILGFTDTQKIIHNCKTKKGSSGSPILSLKTFKVLGIHSAGGNKEGDKENNMGYYLYNPLNEFIKYIKSTPNQDKNEKKNEKKENVKD
jgi:V8-like Glu-specific endopeptidase